MNNQIDRAIVERIAPSVYTPTEAADAAGVSRATIYNWMGSGKLSCFRTAGGTALIWRGDLERVISERAAKLRTLNDIACCVLKKLVMT